MCSAPRGVFVQLAQESGRAGLEWLDSSSAWQPKGIPRSWAGAHWWPSAGVIPRPGPAVKGTASRGRARTPPPTPPAWARSRGGEGDRVEARRLQVRADPSSVSGGGGGRPASSGEETQWLCQLSQLAGARLPRGRAPAPPAGALPLCLLSGSLRPDTAGGREWDARAGAGAGAAAAAGRGRHEAGGSGAGAMRGVLIARQRKELDASKALFAAGLCLLGADV